MKHTTQRHAPALALIFAIAAGAATGEEPAQPVPADAPSPHAMHGRHHGPPDAADMTRHMQEDLGLSEEQAAKVRALNEEQVARMKTIRGEHDAALQKVLSPEQYAKFRKSREEHQGRMRREHHGPQPE